MHKMQLKPDITKIKIKGVMWVLFDSIVITPMEK